MVAGIRDLNDESGQRAYVQSFKVHPDYEPLVTGDIAIMKIYPPFKLDGIKIDKIDVSGTKRIGVGQNLMVSGWGSIEENITFPNRLQKLVYKSISNEECVKHMSNVTKAEICTWARNSHHASCPVSLILF